MRANQLVLSNSFIDSILGEILVISDDQKLYFLEFREKQESGKVLEKLKIRFKAEITPGITNPIKSITSELKQYFAGTLKEFKTPIHIEASAFQEIVWQELANIPYGKTISYKEQAKLIGNPKSFRAVANANAANRFVILLPCHRVINANGQLGGYAGGINRKQWLIEHEKRN